MALRILIEDSEGKSKFAPIDPEKNEITIGRNPGNFIRLKEQNVSRNHAKIYANSEGQLYIEPVAARYGLKVNSSKIVGPTPISLGDEIKIGDYRLYIQDENQPDIRKEDDTGQVFDIEPALQPRFVVISSNFAGREYHVIKSRVTIGRNPTSDIQIQHQSVSGDHAEVRRNSRGEYEIKDLKSSNGTKVNGIPIDQPYVLNSGDAITLGHVTMRYCAPGDFWSLNFGINDEPPRSAITPGMLIVILAIFFLLFIIALIVVVQTMQNQQASQDSQQTTEGTEKSKREEFDNAIKLCQLAMSKGSFDEAKLHCNKAQSLFPNDEIYIHQSKQLQKELASESTYKDVVAYINEERCRDAIDSLQNIEKNTWADKKLFENNLKSKAIECLELNLFRSAMSAIKAEEYGSAEIARDEIKEFKTNSEYIIRIDDELKKARKTSAKLEAGGTPSKHKSGGGGGEAVAAPASQKAADGDELCIKAANAKVKGQKCEAYKLYRKAKDAGITNASCQRNADSHIAAYAAECNK